VEQSPNAGIFPAPLETPQKHDANQRFSAPAPSETDRSLQSSKDPTTALSLREDEPLQPDTLRPRDSQGLFLEARFTWPASGGPGLPPEANPAAIAQARQRSVLGVDVDLSPAGRMRWRFASNTFALPRDAELRSRVDLFGHLLVWPDQQSYRVIRTGQLRALFAERRADAGPLMPGQVAPEPDGTLLGVRTRRTQVSSALGAVTLHQVALDMLPPGSAFEGLAPAGILLCRLLVELAGVEPNVSACSGNLVPLRAEYGWNRGGRLYFEVTHFERPRELPLPSLRVPPDNPHFKADLLPPGQPGVFLSPSDLGQFRSRDLPERAASTQPSPFAVVPNPTDVALYLLLDGATTAWIPPGGEVRISGLRRGKYNLAWRDFFGGEPIPPRALELPAVVEAHFGPDAPPASQAAAPAPQR
jgi:hypothetical protein